MRLFITAEGIEDMRSVIREIDRELEFVTAKDKGLEDIDNYGTEFKTLYIIPTILPNQNIEIQGWEEVKLVCSEKREADIRLFIDCVKYLRTTRKKQKLLFIKAIIDSIDVVIEKSKGDFRGEELKRDILNALKVKKEKLDNLGKSRKHVLKLKRSVPDMYIEYMSVSYALLKIEEGDLGDYVYKVGKNIYGEPRCDKELYDNTNTFMKQFVIGTKEDVDGWKTAMVKKHEELFGRKPIGNQNDNDM